MVTKYVRPRPGELAELRRLLAEQPREAHEYAVGLGLGDGSEASSARGMDTDKAWGGLQYLLAKAGVPVDVFEDGEPLTELQWGYDAPRLLGAEEVAEAARFLAATPFASLAAFYDAADLTAAEVYPEVWDVWDDDRALTYLDGHYRRLVRLFTAAAADGEPMVVWMG
jgi:hypothetical protein